MIPLGLAALLPAPGAQRGNLPAAIAAPAVTGAAQLPQMAQAKPIADNLATMYHHAAKPQHRQGPAPIANGQRMKAHGNR